LLFHSALFALSCSSFLPPTHLSHTSHETTHRWLSLEWRVCSLISPTYIVVCSQIFRHVTVHPMLIFQNATVRDWDLQLNISVEERLQLRHQHVRSGIPVSHRTFCILHQTDFLTAYSPSLKTPLWTAFLLDNHQVGFVSIVSIYL